MDGRIEVYTSCTEIDLLLHDNEGYIRRRDEMALWVFGDLVFAVNRGLQRCNDPSTTSQYDRS